MNFGVNNIIKEGFFCNQYFPRVSDKAKETQCQQINILQIASIYPNLSTYLSICKIWGKKPSSSFNYYKRMT